MEKYFITIISVIILMYAAGCRQDLSTGGGEPTPTPQPGTISGKMTGLAGDQAGKIYAVYADTDKNPGNGYSALTFSACAAGSEAEYLTMTVNGGRYYVYSYIDMNNNGINDEGDYRGYHGAVYPSYPMSGDAKIDADDYEADIVMAIGAVNVSGTVMAPVDIQGDTLTMIMDADANPGNGGFVTIKRKILPDGAELNDYIYFLSPAYPGKYYIYAFIDTDGSGMSPESGIDYIGTLGSLVSPQSISINDLSSVNGPFNITVTVMP